MDKLWVYDDYSAHTLKRYETATKLHEGGPSERQKWEFQCFALTYSVISKTSFAMERYTGWHIVPITKFHVDVDAYKRFQMWR